MVNYVPKLPPRVNPQAQAQLQQKLLLRRLLQAPAKSRLHQTLATLANRPVRRKARMTSQTISTLTHFCSTTLSQIQLELARSRLRRTLRLEIRRLQREL